MALKKTDWIFVLVAGGVIATLVVLSMVSRTPKPISPIEAHVGITTETPRPDCLACHDPTLEGAVAPLKPAHPHIWKKEQVQCTTCHVVPNGRIDAASPATAQYRER